MSTLSDLIGWVETRGNYTAFRFEHATFLKLLIRRTSAQKTIIAKIIAAHGGDSACSWTTALMIYSTSWGVYQIMGFNLYGYCEYPYSVFRFLKNGNDEQIIAFRHFLESEKLDKATPENLAAHKILRDIFSVTYNGSVDYSVKLEAALQHFGYTINKD